MKHFFLLILALLLASCNSDFYKLVDANSVSGNVAPGSFTLTSATQGNSKIILSWAGSSEATTYIVKYGTVSGSYPTVASTNATSPFEVTGLTNGVEYFFKVIAVNSQGSTESTSEISKEAIFLDDFSQLNLGSIWQRSSNPAAYSSVYNDDPAITISSDGDKLVFGQSINDWIGAKFETTQNFDFTDSWVSTEMSTPPVDDGRYQEAGLWIINSDYDGWEMYKANGNLTCAEWLYSGGASADVTIPFDPIAHRFLRIRHEADDDSINFEASPDGVVWSVIRSVNRTGHPISQLHFILYAYGSNQGMGPSGNPMAKFNSIQSNAPLN